MSFNQDCLGESVRQLHLTKHQRIPKCLKEVEKIIKSVKSCKQNYKTILANSRLRGRNFKRVYSLTVNVLKHYNYIENIMNKVQLLEKEKFLRREIASILIYELLFGSGIPPGESKIVTILKSYENDIKSAHEILQNNLEICERNIPRYARVHTLVTTVPYVIKDLESYGFKQIFYDENLTEEKYLELVQNLEKGTFLVDFHFKDLLVFESRENLVILELYKNGHISLQDKASYIPVHILNPEPSSAVLDACAAPGMKTLHIASKMKNKGILIACERDKTRFESLKQMMEYGSVKICKMLCKDFKLIDPNDQAYSVDYILLDPSCSGSGMVNRMDEVTDTEDSKNKERLRKLAGFQIILLKHALKFPSVKRIVYSTCSVHEEENEYVVHEALASCSGSFKLVSAMPEWSHRGSEDYEFGKLCLRTVPEKHLTNGFFVAVFERVDSNEYTGRRFSKKRKTQVDGSDNFPSEISSGFEKKDLSELQSENHENFLDNNDHKSKYSKRRKCEYNMQYSLYSDENKEVESYNQTKTDGTELENSNCMQQKSKKHKSKMKEKNLNEFSQNCYEIKLEPTHGALENARSDVSIKSKKHKHEKVDNISENVEIIEKQSDIAPSSNKLKPKHYSGHENIEIFPTATSNILNKHIEINSNQNIDHENFECQQKKKKKKKNKERADSPSCKGKSSFSVEFNSNLSITTSHTPNDGIEKCNEKSNINSTDVQEQENSDYVRKKKHKKSKSSENLNKPNDTEQKVSSNVDKNDFTIKENSPLCKKKKAKRAKVEEIYLFETQTTQFPNDFDTSAQDSKNNLQIECIGSTENVPVKKKKHKKHSKNLDSNDVSKESSISINDSGLFNQSSKKSTEILNNVFQDQEHPKALLEMEESSHKHGKKKKHQHSDADLNSVTNDTLMTVFDNELSLIPNDYVSVNKIKRHKSKMHKI